MDHTDYGAEKRTRPAGGRWRRWRSQ